MDNTNFPPNHDRKLRRYGGEKIDAMKVVGGKPRKIPHASTCKELLPAKQKAVVFATRKDVISDLEGKWWC